MKLNVYLARSGVASRRKAASFIKEGKVTVYGKIVTDPSFDVKPGAAIKVNKKLLDLENKIYLIFNKPKGVTSTVEDRFAEKKVVDFIPKKYGRLYPVGRLDKFSRGLMVLTNDGELCYQLTHPKFEIEKEYLVTLKARPDDTLIERLKKGIEDEGDILKVKAAFIEESTPAKTIMRVIVCEGKKRHLRRLFEGVGFIISDLQRIRIGELVLDDLKEGKFRVVPRASILP